MSFLATTELRCWAADMFGEDVPPVPKGAHPLGVFYFAALDSLRYVNWCTASCFGFVSFWLLFVWVCDLLVVLKFGGVFVFPCFSRNIDLTVLALFAYFGMLIQELSPRWTAFFDSIMTGNQPSPTYPSPRNKAFLKPHFGKDTLGGLADQPWTYHIFHVRLEIRLDGCEASYIPKIACQLILVFTILLGGGNSNIFYVHPYLGKSSNLTNIYQMGWNHQLVLHWEDLSYP